MHSKYHCCLVVPDGQETAYSYIYEGETAIKPGTRVRVPLGTPEQIVSGTVTSVACYTEGETPHITENTKFIFDLVPHEQAETSASAGEQKNSAASGPVTEETHQTSAPDTVMQHIDTLVRQGKHSEAYHLCRVHALMGEKKFMERIIGMLELAASNGEDSAYNEAAELGEKFFYGTECPHDFPFALRLLFIAARGQHSGVYTHIGEIYMHGLIDGPEYDKARTYLLRGALFDDDPVAYSLLGDIYMFGLGREADPNLGWEFYRATEKRIPKDGAVHIEDGILKMRYGMCFLHISKEENAVETAFAYLSEALCIFYNLRDHDCLMPERIRICKELKKECEKRMAEDM